MFHNLEVEMVKARITQNQLAEVVGVTPTTMSLKLNGKSELTLKECLLIKKALKTILQIEYLFEPDNQPKKAG